MDDDDDDDDDDDGDGDDDDADDDDDDGYGFGQGDLVTAKKRKKKNVLVGVGKGAKQLYAFQHKCSLWGFTAISMCLKCKKCTEQITTYQKRIHDTVHLHDFQESILYNTLYTAQKCCHVWASQKIISPFHSQHSGVISE